MRADCAGAACDGFGDLVQRPGRPERAQRSTPHAPFGGVPSALRRRMFGRAFGAAHDSVDVTCAVDVRVGSERR